MKMLLFALLGVMCGAANADDLQRRKEVLLSHIESYGKDMKKLDNSQLLGRCELALDLLETPIIGKIPNYWYKVHSEWAMVLRNEQTTRRLSAIASAGANAARTSELRRRIAALPDEPIKAAKIPDNGVTVGSFGSSGTVSILRQGDGSATRILGVERNLSR